MKFERNVISIKKENTRVGRENERVIVSGGTKLRFLYTYALENYFKNMYLENFVIYFSNSLDYSSINLSDNDLK